METKMSLSISPFTINFNKGLPNPGSPKESFSISNQSGQTYFVYISKEIVANQSLTVLLKELDLATLNSNVDIVASNRIAMIILQNNKCKLVCERSVYNECYWKNKSFAFGTPNNPILFAARQLKENPYVGMELCAAPDYETFHSNFLQAREVFIKAIDKKIKK